jgi:Tfp pilus assembly protein PilO
MKSRSPFSIPPNTFRIPIVLVAILGYSLLLVASNFFIIKPQMKRFEDLKQRQTLLSETYLQLRTTDIEKILQTLKKETSYNETVRQNFAQRCLSPVELTAILNNLNRIAIVSGMKVLSIDPLPNQKHPISPYIKKPISMRLAGDYNQFLKLLYNLSRTRYWLLLDNFTISPQNAQQQLVNLSLYTVME